MVETEIKIKSYSKKELAGLYQISEHVLRVWLMPFQVEIGEYIGKNYTPKQIEIIFTKLGKP